MATRDRVRSDRGGSGDARAAGYGISELVGTEIDGRYRIVDVIGSGGMARVFRAEQLRLQRPVAIKVLDPEFGRISEVVQRFEREAVAIARLDHPNCVTVFDAGQLEDGSLYLVMQLLDGTPLTDEIARGRLPPRRALHVARHIASGLAHAHRAGIAHRDIKADNVMLVPNEGDRDFAVILDFGIAKMIEPDDAAPSYELTTAGQRFGTPAYMSPEQAMGTPIDERTDLYSACVLLFEMLTGRRPFEADDDASVLAMQASDPPPTLAQCVPRADFPDELELLVAQGLVKDPDDRYSSASELIVAIDSCSEALFPGSVRPATEPTVITVPAAPPRTRWWTRKRIAIAVAVAVLAVIVLTLFGAKKTDYAGRAERLLADGKPDEAIAYLEQSADDIDDDAAAQLQLGHAYAAARRHSDAIAAYRRAMDEKSSLANDETLRTNLMLMLEDARSGAAKEAAKLLVVELEDDEGRKRVARVASRHRNAAHRAEMRQLAEVLGVGDAVNRVRSYSMDLRQGKTCADRREAVARLRALGDRKAIPALNKARKRKRNKCLRADADAAIEYLRATAE